MPPSALSLALFIIEEGIKLAPGLTAEFQTLFAKADPTAQDWTDLRARVLAKRYQDYVPDSALPADAAPNSNEQTPPETAQAAPAAGAQTAQDAAPAAAELSPAPAPHIFTGQATDPAAA